jgi:hypothetical protein
MQQQRLNKCSMHVVPSEHQALFTNVVIRLDRLQPPSLKINRATAPFANVIIRHVRLQPPSLKMIMYQTQPMQQQQQQRLPIMTS